MIARWLKRLAIAGGVVFVLSFLIVAGSTYYFAAKGLTDAIDKEADVILVLSAGLNRDIAILDDFSSDRVATAVELWRRGVAPWILMSGGLDARIGQHVGERMKQRAINRGVPEPVIFVEGVSTSTFENARFTLRVARAEGWSRAIVVTDDFHVLRALTLFSFWRRDGDLEIIAAAPARGREKVPWFRSALVMVRETLAYPYNIGKVGLQIALDSTGQGDVPMVQ
jgi:uncharacterized SAM-binding protein YcdF (DUF218 family)